MSHETPIEIHSYTNSAEHNLRQTQSIEIKIPKSSHEDHINFELTKRLVILGPNGSGKTRFCQKILELNPNTLASISAQRSASNLQGDPDPTRMVEIRMAHKSPTQSNLLNIEHHFLDDLTLLMSKYQYHINTTHPEISEKKDKEEFQSIEETQIKKLIKIFNDIFLPEIDIDHKTLRLFAKRSGQKYELRDLSDGERSGLYLAARCLCIDASVIVVDEPEKHLHPSLTSHFWTTVESSLPEKKFIYLTHDVNFHSSIGNSKTLFISDYIYPNLWTWVEYDNHDGKLPVKIVSQFLGKGKNILFIEGTKDSLDYSFYSHIYKEFIVIPVGSCEKVREFVKIVNNDNNPCVYQNAEAFGIIDRDYRTEEDKESNISNSIYVTDLHDLETLVLVDEVIDYIASKNANSNKKENIKSNIKELISAYLNNELKTPLLKARVSQFFKRDDNIEIISNQEKTNQNLDAIHNIVDEEIKSIKADQRYALRYIPKEFLTRIYRELGFNSCDVLLNNVWNSILKDDISLANYFPEILQISNKSTQEDGSKGISFRKGQANP